MSWFDRIVYHLLVERARKQTIFLRWPSLPAVIFFLNQYNQLKGEFQWHYFNIISEDVYIYMSDFDISYISG